jgi:glutaredoxin 3
MNRVVVYSTRTCGYCRAAEALLTRRGISFERIEVGGDPAMRRWLAEATRRRTVPQIFIDGRPIGGMAELSALDREGKLVALAA